jgi:hypothetical protein
VVHSADGVFDDGRGFFSSLYLAFFGAVLVRSFVLVAVSFFGYGCWATNFPNSIWTGQIGMAL